MSAGNSGGHNPGIDEMPPQMRESVARYERANGQKMPVNEAEAGNYGEVEHPDHPHDSIIEDAKIGAISFFEEDEDPNEHEEYGQVTNRNMVDDPDIVTDGGHEFEHMKVYSVGDTVPEDIAAQTSDYEDADVYSFGPERVAVAGSRSEVNELVSEVRQQLGASVTEYFFNESIHDEVPEPETGVMSRYETGGVDMSDVDHEGPDPDFGGSTQQVAADGSGDPMMSFAGERVYHDGLQNDPSDDEGRMGM